MYETHEVTNQSPPLYPFQPFDSDNPLQEAITREKGDWGMERCRKFGTIAGSIETLEHAERAERNEPVLQTHDRFGRRIDRIDLDPSWNWLLRKGIEAGLHALPWSMDIPGSHVVRGGLAYLWSQVNIGVMTPLATTHSAIPLMKSNQRVFNKWGKRLLSHSYDQAILAGITTTEKQGGADLRKISTIAKPAGEGEYEITGHKWFCSYPSCDIFITLARTSNGLSCFLIESNDDGFTIQRLKEKMGTRSLPSAEVEFFSVRGNLIGNEGEGLKMIMRMINLGRFDCVLSSAGLMRIALTQAIHHARHRKAFGSKLLEQPLMQNVLADLALESEATTTTVFRIARALDENDSDFARLITALMKYWICKRTPVHVNECMECLGGNGYIEESTLPRLYRDAPLNAIWEGPGNIAALDVLRIITKRKGVLERFIDECEYGKGENPLFDDHLDKLKNLLFTSISDKNNAYFARRLTGSMAVTFQASLLLRYAPSFVSDAFCENRLLGNSLLFGQLSNKGAIEKIVERAMPY